MNCPACGRDLPANPPKFCAACGQALHATCPHCAQSIYVGAKFCRHCGKPLEAPVCPRCRRENRATAVHCIHCGTRLKGHPPVHPYGTGKLPQGKLLVGRYVIAHKIAQGGMGAVYEATDTRHTGQRLAIKEMSFFPIHQLKPETRQHIKDSFRREFDLLSTLVHPNLVRAYAYFEDQQRPYIVMEYIDGQTLETILQQQTGSGRFLPVARVLHWAQQLCTVLAYLHAQNPSVIYRDLKPSNVMVLAGTDQIKLIDFGIARFYKPARHGDTVKFGTPGYVAPEVANGAQTNSRTDVYALGALLHQLLTHRDPTHDPFQFPPITSQNSAVPAPVCEAVERALHLRPEERMPTMEAFSQALSNALGQSPISVVDETLATLPVSAGHAPAEFSPPGFPPAPPPPRQLTVSLPTLAFDSRPRGAVVTRQLQVMAPVQVAGYVSANQPWVTIQPTWFSAPQAEIRVEAHTEYLPYGMWTPAHAPRGYQRIPRGLRWWVDVHARQLVPAAQEHQGTITVGATGLLPVEVGIQVTVQPPAWRVRLAWLGVGVLLALEAGLLINLLLFFLLGGLS